MCGIVIAMNGLVMTIGEDGQMALRLVRLEHGLWPAMAWFRGGIMALIWCVLSRSYTSALSTVRAAAVVVILLRQGFEIQEGRMMFDRVCDRVEGGCGGSNGRRGGGGGLGLGVAQVDAFFLCMWFLAAVTLDMGRPLLALGATVRALGYRPTLLGHEGEFSVCMVYPC